MSLENMGRSNLHNNREFSRQNKILSKFGSIFKGVFDKNNIDRVAIVVDKQTYRKNKRLENPVIEETPTPTSQIDIEPIVEAVIEEKEAIIEVVKEPISVVVSGSSNSTSFSSGSTTNNTSRF